MGAGHEQLVTLPFMVGSLVFIIHCGFVATPNAPSQVAMLCQAPLRSHKVTKAQDVVSFGQALVEEKQYGENGNEETSYSAVFGL